MRSVKESQMKSLKSRRAENARRELVLALGGKCKMCPATDELEMDCITPQGSFHHYMPWPERVRFYWQQFLAGNLQALCQRCHRRKTALDNRNHKSLSTKMQLAPMATDFPKFCAVVREQIRMRDGEKSEAED